MSESYARAHAALRWAGVVRRRWMHEALRPAAEIPDARSVARARSLLGRAERRAEGRAYPREAPSEYSPLPDVAARQLRDRRARSRGVRS